jgi:disulfide oxidoreductase YuzD
VDKLKAQAKSDGDFSRKKFIANLRQELHTKYPQIPIYYASTVMPEHLKDIKDNLFIVGLAQRYSTDRIDNLAMVKKYLERDFRLDYLHHEWYRENLIGKNLINRMNLNYMIPMVMLAEHYASSGENERAQEWFNFALTLAEKAGNEEAVKEVKEKMGK